MGNCLVTKFKATADNNNMLPMGVIRLHFTFDSPGAIIAMPVLENYGATEDVILTIVGDATWDTAETHFTYVDSKTAKLKTNQIYYHYSGTNNRYLRAKADNVASGSFYVDIENKYALKKWATSGGGGKLNTEAFEYLLDLTMLVRIGDEFAGNISYLNKNTVLTEIGISYRSSDGANNELYGDISVFANKPNLTRIEGRYCKGLYGDIASLGNLANLTFIRFQDSKVSGNLNTMLDNMYAAGKRGNINVHLQGTDVEYTGTKDVKTEGISFTFDDNGWTENL